MPRDLLLWVTLACATAFAGDPAMRPGRKPLDKYQTYVREAEARMQQEIQSPTYLWAARSPARWERVRSGEAVVEPWNAQGDSDIGDALIHDWIGAFFIPGVKLTQVAAFLQNYAVHKNFYPPEVIDSRLLEHNGNGYRLHYRLVKKKILTVVLDTEHTANYYPISATRMVTSSYTTRIAEVKDAGKPEERELPPGKDHGFLWRLNTYWPLEEKDGGVYLECRSISLSRSVPYGLGWLINPIIRSLPSESLAHLLTTTSQGVRSQAP
jgi:hypothetical protein